MRSTGRNGNGTGHEPHGTAAEKLTALMRREAAVKAALGALREEKKRQRSINRATAGKINTLIGAAVTADVEAAGEDSPRRKTYISEILNHYYAEGSGARALLEENGWLGVLANAGARRAPAAVVAPHRVHEMAVGKGENDGNGKRRATDAAGAGEHRHSEAVEA